MPQPLWTKPNKKQKQKPIPTHFKHLNLDNNNQIIDALRQLCDYLSGHVNTTA